MRVRAALRTKLVRAVDEVMARHREEQTRELAELDRRMSGVTDRVIEDVRAAETRSWRDLLTAAEREAAASSARFVQREMRAAVSHPHPRATLEHALKLAPTGGMALEFGVYTGTTLTIIAAARGDGEVYGFDSFAGLPENWRAGFDTGAFGLDAPPEVPGSELVVGMFDETVP